jgi:hypothetical protein
VALANLGRLDSDLFEDFAVGAPYDGANKEGAVYIYSGSPTFTFGGDIDSFLCISTAAFKMVSLS